MTPEEQVKNFLEGFQGYKRVIVCTVCGSTKVDQMSLTNPEGMDTIKCGNCGNTMSWNGGKFALLRVDDLTAPAEANVFNGIQDDVLTTFITVDKARNKKP